MTLSKPEDFDIRTLAADEQRSLRSNQSVYPRPGSVELSVPLENLVPVAEETVQLLEERQVVNCVKRKVGEVIVRKEIETRIIEVPVRREKLIVEQVNPDYKQLAVIDLGQGQEDKLDTEAASALFPSTVEGRFTSTSAAIQFLEAIAAQPNSGLQSVQISIEMKMQLREIPVSNC